MILIIINLVLTENKLNNNQGSYLNVGVHFMLFKSNNVNIAIRITCFEMSA